MIEVIDSGLYSLRNFISTCNDYNGDGCVEPWLLVVILLLVGVIESWSGGNEGKKVYRIFNE